MTRCQARETSDAPHNRSLTGRNPSTKPNSSSSPPPSPHCILLSPKLYRDHVCCNTTKPMMEKKEAAEEQAHYKHGVGALDIPIELWKVTLQYIPLLARRKYAIVCRRWCAVIRAADAQLMRLTAGSGALLSHTLSHSTNTHTNWPQN